MATRDEQRFRKEQANFEAVFRAHYPEILRYLAARLGSPEEAADIAAEVFLEAFRRLPSLRWRGRPVLAWLYRVAANMAADELKRQARLAAERDVAHESRDESEALLERQVVEAAMRRLPADYQLVIHLRLVEDYPFREVARLMGRSVGACEMLLLRAGRALRLELEREGLHAPI